MKNIDFLSLEYAKLVNNSLDFNHIYDRYHNMNKEVLDYNDYFEDEYVGFDMESLEFYEDWLSGDRRY